VDTHNNISPNAAPRRVDNITSPDPIASAAHTIPGPTNDDADSQISRAEYKILLLLFPSLPAILHTVNTTLLIQHRVNKGKNKTNIL